MISEVWDCERPPQDFGGNFDTACKNMEHYRQRVGEKAYRALLASGDLQVLGSSTRFDEVKQVYLKCSASPPILCARTEQKYQRYHRMCAHAYSKFDRAIRKRHRLVSQMDKQARFAMNYLTKHRRGYSEPTKQHAREWFSTDVTRVELQHRAMLWRKMKNFFSDQHFALTRAELAARRDGDYQ